MAVFLPDGARVSFSILAASAALSRTTGGLENVRTLGRLLDLAAGSAAKVCFALGLFVTGLTVSLTDPLAAPADTCEGLGWPSASRSHNGSNHAEPHRETLLLTIQPYREGWETVLVVGVAVALVGWSPLHALVAAFQMHLTARQDIASLPLWYHILGGTVTLICVALSLRTLWAVALTLYGEFGIPLHDPSTTRSGVFLPRAAESNGDCG